MGNWFDQPLFYFFAGVVVGFAVIRFSVRMIRAQVRWWPGNVTPGGLHIHHMVFGVVLMVVGGVAGLAVPDTDGVWVKAAATLFGLGTALVLDEFALILHLSDVYWTEQGRTSVDAVFVAIALTGLILLGVQPIGVGDFKTASEEGGNAAWALAVAALALNLGLAAITLIKGKIWTGLLGVFLPILILVGAIRLARPHSPWARWRYSAHKLARATRREQRLRRPVVNAVLHVQDTIAGRPSDVSGDRHAG
ncbi:hypothetical protein [Phytohabitans rumicis]|uniref:Membrane protein n=1 Tax=Phytohabitans rumicis TaxID=1076125 RepID=A0A6V8L1L3_9ACTN|nr:hypothetical protein [Phytohabitans rumicis]GFJ89470.1 membrane protein [Phytohabitans rumicis]